MPTAFDVFLQATIFIIGLFVCLWLFFVFIGVLSGDPFPFGPQEFKLPWKHDKYCVCQKCERSLIKENRKRLDKKYARQMRAALENHVRIELETEYRKNYGN